jgi:hypothetical protein
MAHARELIAAVVPEATCRLIFARLSEIALSDDSPLALETARVLMASAFGIPGQEDDEEEA